MRAAEVGMASVRAPAPLVLEEQARTCSRVLGAFTLCHLVHHLQCNIRTTVLMVQKRQWGVLCLEGKSQGQQQQHTPQAVDSSRSPKGTQLIMLPKDGV